MPKGVRIPDTELGRDFRPVKVKLPEHQKLKWEATKRGVSLSKMIGILLDNLKENEKENNG